MANKRMMNIKIIDSDDFIKMPMSARLLYYDLCMRADDDGIVDAILKIMKMTGATTDDLQVLITKNYIIPFESGVLVITHWLIHNTLRLDRYVPTIHIDEKNQLIIVNKLYKKNDGLPTGNHLATNWQPSIDKYSSNNSNNIIDQVDEFGKNIFEIIESEFGRTLSPMEVETIKTWKFDLAIIKLAVKEASTSNQRSIKYIDKIIYNWHQANVRTVDDVERYCNNFKRKQKMKGKNQLQNSSTCLYKEL